MALSTFSQFTDSVLLHRRFTLRRARHSSAAQLVSLEFTDGTYESIYLVAFILVGPVYHNVLTDCAALSCRACVDLITCVAERYLTLRTGCEKHGRKNPLPFPLFRSGHMSAICARLSKGKGRFTRGWKPQVSTLLCARAASAHVPALRRAQLPAESQRKRLPPG